MVGTLVLMNGDDVVQRREYADSARKAKLIESWKKTYGKKFSQLTVYDEIPLKKAELNLPKFKKGSLPRKIKYNRVTTRRKSSEGGVIW